MTGDKLPSIFNHSLNGNNTGIVINPNSFNHSVVSQWSYPGQCHGCSGRGWVETSDRTPHKCPVCEGQGKYTAPFSPVIQPNPWQPSIPTYPQYPWSPPWTIISSSDKSGHVPVISGTSVGNVTMKDLLNNVTFTKDSTGL